MNINSEILVNLIDEDFGMKTRDYSRWGKGEEHDSLVVDKERGIFFWNSKNIVGDPLVYLTKVRGMDFNSAKEYLKNFGYSGTHVYTIFSEKEDVVVYPRLVDVFFEDGKKKRDYFYARGLTDTTIDRYSLGWYNDFSIVPFFEDGTFRNFQMRKDNPVKIIKSYYKGVGTLLFNMDILKLVNKVYYAEGPVDAMILSQNGLPAISSTGGGAFKPEWYSRFVNLETIYLLFDNDTAGINEAIRLAKFLGTVRCKIYTFEDFEEKGYDPVDYFRDGNKVDDLLELIETKSKYAFELRKGI